MDIVMYASEKMSTPSLYDNDTDDAILSMHKKMTRQQT